ncbi:MAG: FAD:protein FMN transferase [Clostridia bacterium]|nr:FAD:protein FMN transferase [Clostridia bacterium]
MKVRHPSHVRLLALLLLLAALLSGCSGQEPAPEPTSAPVKRSGVGFYFDTVVTATLYGGEEGLLDEIWAACARYENLLSKTIAGSDVDRINKANGETVTVDPETWAILQRAKDISQMTGGAFAVTIAPMTAMWDFTDGTNRMPTDEQRLSALPLVNDEAIALGDNNTVTLPAGMEIDLGGIAKGYIADQVAKMVEGRVSGAVLSLGGNVYVLGSKPDGSTYNVGIQDPDGGSGSVLAVVNTTDRSVVTSGIYERQFTLDGVTYHHILDPVDGLPSCSDLSSATIIGKSSMDADALATACIVLGREKALEMMAEQGIEGVLITRDRQVYKHQTSDTFQLNMLVDIPVQ